jgi:hypothetical protein
MTPTRFHEAQRLRPPRFGWLVAFPPALLTALAIAQRWAGHPLGPHPLSDRRLAATSIFLWLVYIWLSRVQLVTDIDDEAVTVRLSGLGRRHQIPLASITSASVVAFNAETDFGGRGFRAVPVGRAYVARSGRGVRLELQGGGFAVIGSACHEQLLAAVQSSRTRRSR